MTERKPRVAQKYTLDARDAERFWTKVNKTENCWLWTGSSFHSDYGRFHVRLDTGQWSSTVAHRVGMRHCRACGAQKHREARKRKRLNKA